jgi:hypothetical protein
VTCKIKRFTRKYYYVKNSANTFEFSNSLRYHAIINMGRTKRNAEESDTKLPWTEEMNLARSSKIGSTSCCAFTAHYLRQEKSNSNEWEASLSFEAGGQISCSYGSLLQG